MTNKIKLVLAGILATTACTNQAQNKNMSHTTHEIPKTAELITNDTTAWATFGEGCFWCVENMFGQLKGVRKVESGYAGGHVPNPSYKQVCTGTTDHAEVVQIEFDPTQISFAELLEVFFKTHDPTTLNQQGADIGTQYRSVIFFHNEEQKRLSELAIKTANESGDWKNPIVTELSPYANFYKAEDYHQDYYALNGSEPYCRIVIAPKVEKFQKLFKEKLKHSH